MTMPANDQSALGLTTRDLVLELRTSISAWREDFLAFKPTVVTKAELDLFRESQKTTRRWSIGIICSIIGASSAGVSIVMAFSA